MKKRPKPASKPPSRRGIHQPELVGASLAEYQLRNSPPGAVQVEALGNGIITMSVDRRAYTNQDPPPCEPAPDVPLVDLSTTNRDDIDNVFNPRSFVLVSRAVMALALKQLPDGLTDEEGDLGHSMMDTFRWDLILMAGRCLLEPDTDLDRIPGIDGGGVPFQICIHLQPEPTILFRYVEALPDGGKRITIVAPQDQPGLSH